MTKKPCRLCGRLVRYRIHPATGRVSNRYTYRHKCPHGNWCRAGNKLTGNAHANVCCPVVVTPKRLRA